MIHFSIIDKLLKTKPLKIAVGVSGGADSLCLTNILNQWCNEYGIELSALIVDHKLREESTNEAEFVKVFLNSKNINAKILTWDNAIKPTSNIQNIARSYRFKLFYDECRENNIKHLFLGHTLNDQAETVLMRIMRGSGIDGICGIKKISHYKNLQLIRPLLHISRQDIENHLNKVGWNWINDPSNYNIKYERIKVRNVLKALNGASKNNLIYNRINLLATNAFRTKSYLDKRIGKIWKNYVIEDKLNFLTLSNSCYNFHDEICLRLIAKILKYFNPQKPPARLKSLSKLLDSLRKYRTVTKTLGECKIIKKEDSTLIYLELGKRPIREALKTSSINYFKNIKIITKQESLKAIAIGVKGWRKLKQNRISKPKNIPVGVMHSLVGIYKDKNLVAVPQLNFQINNGYKIIMKKSNSIFIKGLL